MIVADTNLVAQIVTQTTETALAEAVLTKDPDWRVPILWQSEMQNLLATRMRVLKIPLSEALLAMSDASRLIQVSALVPDSETILKITSATNLSAYDAEFLALARRLQVTLVTSDRKILAADPDVAKSPEQFLAE